MNMKMVNVGGTLAHFPQILNPSNGFENKKIPQACQLYRTRFEKYFLSNIPFTQVSDELENRADLISL
jgi:hypothetical protein